MLYNKEMQINSLKLAAYLCYYKYPEHDKQGFHLANVLNAARPDIQDSQNLETNFQYRPKLYKLG